MVKFPKRGKESSATSATLSSLPVPPSDSALVIDLPEGQKLVLGKMDEGTVIEVATWRGTGRPDSRTNRLMLGVSFGGANPEEAGESKAQPEISGMRKFQRIFQELMISWAALYRKVRLNLSNRFSAIRTRRRSSMRSNKKETSIPADANKLDRSEDVEIEAWLESIRSQSRLSGLREADRRDNAKAKKKGNPRHGKKAGGKRGSPPRVVGSKKEIGKKK